MGAVTVRAGIYCRMSLAIQDDTAKIDDQERMCRLTAERLGWEVIDVYQDNNRSAWKHNRKRPAWDRMLADIGAGKINGIIVYHGDRLTRQPMDLEILISLSRTRGIKLASPTGVRDLNDDDHQFQLGIEANVYRKESAATSRRRKMQYERWRREGRTRPGGRGGRAYGFATDGITQVPEECQHIRDMAGMLLDGAPLGGLVRDADARGAKTTAGAPFTHSTIRKMFSHPRYAGLMPDGESTAAWQPVLERETWEKVNETLAAKTATFAYATNARRWLLSGIAICGACGAPMQMRPSKGRGGKDYKPGYGCSAATCRKAYRAAPLLDAYVMQRLVSLLADPRNPAAEIPAPDHAPEWKALAGERAETERLLADYQASAGRAGLLTARLDSIDARMKELRALADTTGRDRLAARYQGITLEQLQGAPLEVRRALVAGLLRVEVLPASRRGPGFRTEDVRVTAR